MKGRKHPRLHINLRLVGLFLLLLLSSIGYREYKRWQERKKMIDLPQIHVQGELRALTLYSPTSYFIYRDKEMGYDYELCSMLANDLGLHLKMIAAPNPVAMLQMLQRGEADMIAFNMPITTENKRRYQYCGREFLTHQVLVQQIRPSEEMVRSVTGLIGKKVTVHTNSRYLTRLQSLNEELGGGIGIQTIPHDSFTVEDLIEKVAMGEIEYTVANDNIAQFNSTFYPNISTNVAISFPQRSSWVVRKSSPKLAAAIDRWFRENMRTERYRQVGQRYFESGKYASALVTNAIFLGEKGHISIFDQLFRKYAPEIGWDWHLLASIAYQESKFDPSVENWAGARGLMQIMPKTGRSVGINKNDLFNPEKNILAAVRLLALYEHDLSMISNDEQRVKMTLAAYNCGLGHVTDARALARKHGRNPFKWEDNVRTYILLKSRPEYYEDRVCKLGYLRGTETASFVTDVWNRYKRYKEMVPDRPVRHLVKKKSR